MKVIRMTEEGESMIGARRPAARGNALMEYAVPMAIILVSAGVLATATGITDIMADYFMAASGNSRANLTGSTFRTREMGTGAVGSTGNGMASFTSYATVYDGAGRATGERAGGVYFVGPVSRTGGRRVSTTPEYLFP